MLENPADPDCMDCYACFHHNVLVAQRDMKELQDQIVADYSQDLVFLDIVVKWATEYQRRWFYRWDTFVSWHEQYLSSLSDNWLEEYLTREYERNPSAGYGLQPLTPEQYDELLESRERDWIVVPEWSDNNPYATLSDGHLGESSSDSYDHVPRSDDDSDSDS